MSNLTGFSLYKLKDIAFPQTGKDMNAIRHEGAAGGTAAGLNIFLYVRLVHGIEYFLDITGFDEALRKADLVITGEGSIDLQTLEGNGPFGVIFCKQAGIDTSFLQAWKPHYCLNYSSCPLPFHAFLSYLPLHMMSGDDNHY